MAVLLDGEVWLVTIEPSNDAGDAVEFLHHEAVQFLFDLARFKLNIACSVVNLLGDGQQFVEVIFRKRDWCRHSIEGKLCHKML